MVVPVAYDRDGCVQKASAMIPWTGCVTEPMFQIAWDATALPYYTGDPAPNDKTEFAARVDAACKIILGGGIE
jgi:hypothetical protein